MVREYEHVGRLYKKRGGLGRHAKSPWVPRTFALAHDGVLEYFDGESRKTPRGTLNLPRAEAHLSTELDLNDEAPTKHMIIITHIQGQRWKLCAESADDLAAWIEKMAKFCRSRVVQPLQPASRSKAEIEARSQSLSADEGRKTPTFAAISTASDDATNGRQAAASAHARPTGIRTERRKSQSKVTKETTSRTLPIWDVAKALAVVNLAALAAWTSSSWPAAVAAAVLVNGYVAALIARSVDQAPPPMETLVSLIVPPARLPLFLRDASTVTRSASDNTLSLEEESMSLPAASSIPKQQRIDDTRDLGVVVGAAGLREVQFDVDGGPPGTWSVAPASTFKIRQPGYAKSKRKAPSDKAFFEVVAVDLFDTDARVGRIFEQVVLPVPAFESPDPDVPSLFVVNAQIPSETGPIRVKLDADGHGYQVVLCMQMTLQTRDELLALADGRADDVPKPRANGLNLLKSFCRLAPDEPQLAPKERGRFKVSGPRPQPRRSFRTVRSSAGPRASPKYRRGFHS